jgi:hypothetical protein
MYNVEPNAPEISMWQKYRVVLHMNKEGVLCLNSSRLYTETVSNYKWVNMQFTAVFLLVISTAYKVEVTIGTEVFSPGAKVMRREADHSPPCM